jgi:hypothetical protein
VNKYRSTGSMKMESFHKGAELRSWLVLRKVCDCSRMSRVSQANSSHAYFMGGKGWEKICTMKLGCQEREMCKW